MIHFTDSYLLYPPHQVTIDLVGVGGTGSLVLTNLARLNAALIGLGHPGIHVRCWDMDEVTQSNMGRQLFSPADVGVNKAVVLVTRINRCFGYDWEAVTQAYTGKKTSNILITCVDTAKARLSIADGIKSKSVSYEPTNKLIYWLDMGNSHNTGQVIIGTINPVKQPKSESKTKQALPTVEKKFRSALSKTNDDKTGPSCSLAEALAKQDLFINSTVAQFGCNLIWKLFREGSLRYHGCYVNLETLTVNPIPIK